MIKAGVWSNQTKFVHVGRCGPMVPAKDLEISKRLYAGLVINLKTA
jgi:hypothetical protein